MLYPEYPIPDTIRKITVKKITGKIKGVTKCEIMIKSKNYKKYGNKK